MYETKFRAETYHSVMTNLQSFNNSFKFSWASVTGVNYLFLTFSLNKCEMLQIRCNMDFINTTNREAFSTKTCLPNNLRSLKEISDL